MKCQECGCRVSVLRLDPRDPPLDERPCLCQDCRKAAVEERIQELQDEISRLKKELK